MTAQSAALRARIAHLCPDWDIGRISGFIYLEGGYSNDNYRFEYRGERFVLRVPRGRTGPFVDRTLERRIYQEGAAAGVPPLIAFDVASGNMICRWVAGTLLTDRHTDGAELVAYLRHLHAHVPAVERRYDPLEQARTSLERAGGGPPWLERLAVERRWEPEQLTTCHNDLNPWNVIRTPDGGWTTLDWEWVGRNDPLFDLVTLHQSGNLEPAELPVMARAYLGEPADPARLNRCVVALWLRETAWALAEVAAGNDRPEIVAQRELGLQRLAESLAATG